MSNRLINCLQKITPKQMPHLQKRGLIHEAAKLMSQGVDTKEAEIRAVTAERDRARLDVATVQKALKEGGIKRPPKEKPGSQASGRRPVQRDVETRAAIDAMHTDPEKAFHLQQAVKASFEKARAKTKAMQLDLAAESFNKAVAQPTPQEALDQLDAKETKAHEDLRAELDAARQKVSDDIAQQYGDRIDKAPDIIRRKQAEALAETARVNRLRGVEREFAAKRRALTADYTRQRQIASYKIRDQNLRQNKETADMAVSVEHVRAFAEMNAITSELPPEVRGRIGGNVTLAQLRGSGTRIEHFLAERVRQIDKEMEAHYQKMYRDRIDTLIKRKLPKRASSGIVKSTVGADAQDVVNRVAKYVKMTMDEVLARAQAIEVELSNPDLTPEQQSLLVIEQHELNTFGATEDMTAAQLEAAHDSLNNTIKAGQAIWGASEEARLADMRAKAKEMEGIYGEAGPAGIARHVEGREKLLRFITRYARNHGSFTQIMDWMFPNLSYGKEWSTRAIKNDMNDEAFRRSLSNRLVDAIGAAIGEKAAWRVGEALMKMTDQVIPAPAAKGPCSQREAIQYLLAWGLPKVQERMIKHGWTEEQIQVLRDATNNPAANALRDFVLNGYEEVYQAADAVYVRMYGMHLPKQEGQYAPMRYHTGGTTGEMNMTGGMPASGVTPSALRSLKSHSAELRQVDALNVFTEHVQQMSHWIHQAEFVRESKGVMGNIKVKMSIEQAVGRDGLVDLQKHLDAITRNGVSRAGDVSTIESIVKQITSGVAISSMAFNAHSAAMQGDSGLRWLFAVPMDRWWRALLIGNWAGMVKPIWKSELIQQRIQGGMNPVTQFVMKRDNMTPARWLGLVEKSLWMINHFDGALTSVSSAIVFSDALDQGMTVEQATERMEDAVHRFSQPTLVTTKARQLVTTNSAATRMLFMFATDPMLKTALVGEGINDIRRGNTELGWRKILAVEIMSLVSQTIMNTLAHATGADADDPDKDPWFIKHWLRALVLAPFQGLFVAGNLTEALWSAVMSERYYTKSPALQSLADHVNKTGRHLHKLTSLQLNDPGFWHEIDNLIKLAGEVAGGPWAAVAGAEHQAAKLVLPKEEKK